MLNEWREVLRLLVEDRARLVGKLDWVTKQWLLETFMHEERIGWSDPWLMSLDLEYHNVNPGRGLYLELEAQERSGGSRRMPISRTRSLLVLPIPGGVRGLCIRRFPDHIKGMQWERIQFTGGVRAQTLEMGDLFEPSEVQACTAIFEQAASPAEALKVWNKRKEVVS